MISRQLGIELATVKNHVHSVLSKLGLHRRAEAALLNHMPEQTGTTTDAAEQQRPLDPSIQGPSAAASG